jgi:hypothetical protein
VHQSIRSGAGGGGEVGEQCSTDATANMNQQEIVRVGGWEDRVDHGLRRHHETCGVTHLLSQHLRG